MKFLIDEQLPLLLSDWLIEKGYDTKHVITLGTSQSMNDKEIRFVSMSEKRVVVTKDEDFFNSYIFQKEPFKLIYLTTGNIKNRALLNLFRAEFDHLLTLLTAHNVIELSQNHIRIWY